MLENFIKSSFGIDCKIEKTKVKGLALYLTAGREFFTVHVEGLSFLLVKIPANDRFGVIALEKQLALLKSEQNSEVAYVFDHLTKLQREALLTRGIPFIAGSEQIFFPFLGVYLRNNLKPSHEVAADKMMPATQCLFLYLLYNNQKAYVLKKQAAEALGLTKTSITRASEQLKAMNLITEEQVGKEIRMKTVASGFALFQVARPHLVTPVQRIVYTERASVCGEMCLAGESALSKVSMLGEPKYNTLAIYKGDDLVRDFVELDIKWQEDTDAVQIELWKYKPELFAKDGIVDPVSLALSLSDNADERVQGELKDFLEGYTW